MNAPNSAALPAGITRKQSLHATVIRACRVCGAPGYWHNTPGVNVGCYAPERVTQLGSDPVGATCPCCGSPRPSVVEDRGEIWSRLYGLRVAVWLNKFLKLLKEIFR
jgi:hypothetical protein